MPGPGRTRGTGVRALIRLHTVFARGTLAKDKVNKYGYNKFLDINKDISVSINKEKIMDDSRWDGLKGYITNTRLPAQEVIPQYHGLWVVERAFRIGKSTLEMRPMFHFTGKRIEPIFTFASLLTRFTRNLNATIRKIGIKMSVDKVLEIAKTITTLKIRLSNGELYSQTHSTQHHSKRPLSP